MDAEHCERWLFRGDTQRVPEQFGERWVGGWVAAVDSQVCRTGGGYARPTAAVVCFQLSGGPDAPGG